MAASLLVVSSGEGGASEVIYDDVTGRRFTPGDPKDLASVLIEIYMNPEYHEKLRSFGHLVCQRRYSTVASSLKLSKLMEEKVLR